MPLQSSQPQLQPRTKDVVAMGVAGSGGNLMPRAVVPMAGATFRVTKTAICCLSLLSLIVVLGHDFFPSDDQNSSSVGVGSGSTTVSSAALSSTASSASPSLSSPTTDTTTPPPPPPPALRGDEDEHDDGTPPLVATVSLNCRHDATADYTPIERLGNWGNMIWRTTATKKYKFPGYGHPFSWCRSTVRTDMFHYTPHAAAARIAWQESLGQGGGGGQQQRGIYDYSDLTTPPPGRHQEQQEEIKRVKEGGVNAINRRIRSWRLKLPLPGFVKHKYRTRYGIEHCLRDKHLVFIGDSRQRYQFVSLLLALVGRGNAQTHNVGEEGKWERPEIHTLCEDLDRRRKEKEDDLGCRFLTSKPNTNYFRMLQEYVANNTAGDGGETELIVNVHRELKSHDPMDKRIENAFFYRRVPNTTAVIKLTFIHTYVPGDLKDHPQYPPSRPIDPRRDPFPSQDRRAPLFPIPDNTNLDNVSMMNMSVYMRTVLPRLEPTHVYASVGWPHRYTDVHEDFSCDLVAAQRVAMVNARIKKSEDHLDNNAFNTNHNMQITHGFMAFLVRQHGADLRQEPSDDYDPRSGLSPAKMRCAGAPGLKEVLKDRHFGAPIHWYNDPRHPLSLITHEHNNMLLDDMCGMP